MKVLLSWLREFVDVREPAGEIARVMSLRGFAVEGIEPAFAEATAGKPAGKAEGASAATSASSRVRRSESFICAA
jgi:hypothetical protein